MSKIDYSEFQFSPPSSDEGGSTLRDTQNQVLSPGQIYGRQNGHSTSMNASQTTLLQPNRRAYAISERTSHSSLGSSPSCSKAWQRSSGRFQVAAVPGMESIPVSPSPSAIYDVTPTSNDCDHDPGRWHTTQKEPDDHLYDVTQPDRPAIWSTRGLLNVGTLIIISMTITMLFMGYPVLTHFYFNKEGNRGGYGLGGTNGTGQVPTLTGIRTGLIDKDTPTSAMRKTGMGPNNNEVWNLQWSDEFETEGRSFYPGDDPFWEAVDLYAHGTGDYEWYSPAAVTTKDGALVISATEQANHNLNFQSGHVTTWNKMCYTGGYLEASVVLPGSPEVSGWWPAVWTMGNLGRANFGATTEGMWPYTYDTCDIGALANQTNAEGTGPIEALVSGGETVFNDKYHTTSLSFQPGQRLSACTCPNEDHPGPKDKNGNWVARGAPEIDLFEGQVDEHSGGTLSMSGQFMPTNAGYWLNNRTRREIDLYESHGKKTEINIYRGNILQQSASGIVRIDQESYELSGNKYSVWGFEYEPGLEGYITWWVDGKKAWTMRASAVGADTRAQISARPIPREPMYIIANLALSSGFGWVDWDKMTFPGKMKIDYLRLYQAKGKENIGCNPKDFPTTDYIERHKEAYTNPNLTVWGGTRDVGGYEQYWPRNRLYDGGDGCSAQPRKYPGKLRTAGFNIADVNPAAQDLPLDDNTGIAR